MQRPLLATSAAASTTALVASVTGATWVLTSSATSDGLSHNVTITELSGVNESAITAVISGKDVDGRPLTETITLPTASQTVTSVNMYSSGITVTPNSTIGANSVSIGISAASATAGVAIGFHRNGWSPIGIGCTWTSGTYSIQYSYGDTQWYNHATIVNKAVSYDGAITWPVAKIRMTFSAPGTVQANIMQAEEN